MMIQFLTRLLICIGLMSSLSATTAQADPLADALSARILPGWRLADGRHIAAVEIKLSPGWKTYWRAPGDAGIPPRFDWRGSGNLTGVQIGWPTPKVMDQGGMQVIGYKDRLILPLTIQPKSHARDVRLKGTLDLGVCREVCLPVSVDLDARLMRDVSKPDARIASAMAARPYSAQEAKVGRVACRISPIEDGLRLTAEIDLPKIRGREVAVIETDNAQIWVAQAKTSRKGQRLTAVTDLYHVEGRSFALNRAGLRITVIGNGTAVDIQGCPAG